MNNILVVTDFQNDFASGPALVPGARKLEEEIYNRIKSFISENNRVFILLDMHNDSYPESREGMKNPVSHCKKGTDGTLPYGRLSEFYSSPYVSFVAKSSFGSKDLAIIIKEKAANPDSIEICGIGTNTAVLSNAVILRSHFKNADIRILSSLCVAKTSDIHKEALDILGAMDFTVI